LLNEKEVIENRGIAKSISEALVRACLLLIKSSKYKSSFLEYVATVQTDKIVPKLEGTPISRKSPAVKTSDEAYLRRSRKWQESLGIRPAGDITKPERIMLKYGMNPSTAVHERSKLQPNFHKKPDTAECTSPTANNTETPASSIELAGSVTINTTSSVLPTTGRLTISGGTTTDLHNRAIVEHLCDGKLVEYPIVSLKTFCDELRAQGRDRGCPLYTEPILVSQNASIRQERPMTSHSHDARKNTLKSYEVVCNVGKFSTTVIGESRKRAKQMAAQAMLKILINLEEEGTDNNSNLDDCCENLENLDLTERQVSKSRRTPEPSDEHETMNPVSYIHMVSQLTKHAVQVNTYENNASRSVAPLFTTVLEFMKCSAEATAENKKRAKLLAAEVLVRRVTEKYGTMTEIKHAQKYPKSRAKSAPAQQN